MSDDDQVQEPETGVRALDTTNVSDPLAERLALLYNVHRTGVSVLAVSLPPVVWGLGSWWFNDSFGSISAYYHSPTGSLFVGFLYVLAAFLFIYGPGLEHNPEATEERSMWVKLWHLSAAVAAVGVATFPTHNPNAVSESTLDQVSARIHGLSAAVLFLLLASFAFSFYLTTKGKAGASSAEARLAALSLLAAIVIVFAEIAAVVQTLRGGDILWPEIVAVVAFGAIWYKHARHPVSM